MSFTTTPRLQLPTWTAPTDGPTRVEFNNGFLNLDNWAARDEQGLSSARPAAAIRGRYYAATDTGVIYRDTGTAWTVVGGVLEGLVVNSSSTSLVTAALNAPSGQTADLIEAKVGSTMEASLSAGGNWTVNGSLVGKRLSLTNDQNATNLIFGRAAAGQSVDVVDIANSDNSQKYLNITTGGTMTSKYFYNGNGASVLNNNQVSNANTSTFDGQPMAEVYGTKSGISSTFKEFMYLRHQGVDSTAVMRRLGLMMKIGEETTADQGRTGGMYIESSNANADTPKLVLFRGDAPVMQFTSTQIQAMLGMLVSGQLQLQPPSNNAQAILFPDGTITGHGYQTGQSAYSRVGTSGSYYWYAGGAHNATAGFPGTGGFQLGSLTNSGGVGSFNAGYGQFTQQIDPIATTGVPSMILGADAINSLSMHMGPTTIQTKNAGYAVQPGQSNQMFVQKYGGDLILARNGYNDEGSQGIVGLPNSLLTKIGKRGFAIQYSTPPSPQVGDIWISL